MRVRMVARKWGDRPHWEHDAHLLGEDEHGVWTGAPAGTHLRRPGAQFDSPQAFVTLVPRDQPFVATFYDGHPNPPASGWVELYVDITTVPVWRDRVLTAVDLDLDVVRGHTGRVWIDDEDEFADHRVRFCYPEDVVALASRSCDRVHAAVRAGAAPFDNALGRRWLTSLEQLLSAS